MDSGRIATTLSQSAKRRIPIWIANRRNLVKFYPVLLGGYHGGIGHEQGSGHHSEAGSASSGITPGSKVEFDLEGGGARLKLVKRHISSSAEAGPAILNYTGPRIAIADMHGGLAMKKAAKRARR